MSQTEKDKKQNEESIVSKVELKVEIEENELDDELTVPLSFKLLLWLALFSAVFLVLPKQYQQKIRSVVHSLVKPNVTIVANSCK